MDQATGHFSPISNCSRGSNQPQPEYVRHSDISSSPQAQSPAHLSIETTPARPRSSPTENQWTSNPLGITSTMPFYSSPSFAPRFDRGQRLSEPAMELHGDMAAPQPRRMYAPIAPNPMAARRMKRSREEDDHPEFAHKRQCSESNTPVMELSEEDRLLLKLKDEEGMPWKDIAGRFQSDLGKTYQIPALQMRLKRLRERMRVWTEVDVKALRMAHEYWVHSKFEIIAQKVSFPSSQSMVQSLTRLDARIWRC